MTLHPQARELLAELEAGDTLNDLDQIRAAGRAAALAVPDRIGLDLVEDLVAATSGQTDRGQSGVPVRLYRPRLGAPVALYVHGGGWVLHDLETHDVFCRYLAHTTGWALLAVDYRRAPEDPFPAPLDDVQRVADWLRAGGLDDHRVDASFLPGIGDSSGANLIAALSVRDPAALDTQVLLYPPVDRTAELDRSNDNAALSADGMHAFWDWYAPDAAPADPEVSPALASDLGSTPPTILVTAEHDVLADQGRAYAASLAEAGVEVTAWQADGMIHSFWRQPDRFDSARSLVVTIGALLTERRAQAGRLA